MRDNSHMFEPLPEGNLNRDAGAHKLKPKQSDWQPIAPVPDDVEPKIPSHKLGAPSATWDYCDAEGRLLNRVCRWDPGDGTKQILPLSYCEDDAGRRSWRWQQMASSRPLYGLDRLAQRRSAPVLVCEGEKAADAAGRLFPEFVSVTSSGGSNAADKADWSPLADRRITIWPDHDKPGRKYADDVAKLARETGASSVRVVAVLSDWPEGWDLADAPPKGATPDVLRKLLADAGDAQPTRDGTGPDMSIVQRAVAPAPKLDLTAFGPLSTWIEEAAESKSAPVDYVAMALLGAVAGVVGATRRVQPWPGWWEPCVIWFAAVGPPSSGKSPGLDAGREPLAPLEQSLAKDWPETRRKYETAKAAAEAHAEKWEADAKAAAKAAKPVTAKPVQADEPDAPQMPRVIINDATIEATAAILSGNSRGLLLWRDELSAWLGSFGKYGDGDRAFWLEAYGARSYIVDRKKHPEPLRLPHLAVSIVGGIQPDRLASLLLTGDDDGLPARFLYTWPENRKPTRPRFRPEGGLVSNALSRLHELDFKSAEEGEDPRPVILQVEAGVLDAFSEWRDEHHMASESTSGLLASAFGKMPGQALRLALVLELMWWAAGPATATAPTQVSGTALGTALNLIDDYFKPMLLRVLGEAALPVADRNAAILGRAILKRKTKEVNAREIKREWRLPGLRDAGAVDAAIDALVDAGWLQPKGGRAGGTAGRQRADYAVNPLVHEVQS